MGRHTTYTPEIADEVCAWIAGGKTLRAFCRQEGKPCYGAVYDWMEKDTSFAARFARARKTGEYVIAQECLEIADDASNDWMEESQGADKASTWRLNGEHVQRSKLRIDTRLKLLAKWNPKEYGDKVEQYISGPDGGPVQSSITVNFVKPNSAESA